MAAVRLTFPTLTPAQEAVLAGARRFNVVSGGRESGLTTLAHDVLLASAMGAVAGKPVALFLPDPDLLLDAKRRVLSLIQPLVRGKPDRDLVQLTHGGSILFRSLDEERVELWDQLALIVIDRASEIERLGDYWARDLTHLLTKHNGQAWFFGKPRGPQSAFGRLAQVKGPEWAAFTLKTADNPHTDHAPMERDRADMSEAAFKQEYEGQFVEGVELSASQVGIAADETFVQWCERLAADGLKVDGHPFRLDNRPAFRWVYEQIPSTIEQARGRQIVLMKCAQVGFTIMELLAVVYLSLKFMPLQIGMYLPDQNLARLKSSERFMPVVRTIPAAYRLMLDGDGTRRQTGEGNVMIRNMGQSRFYFLWTSGKGATESVPLDILSLDEVQEMQLADMEKVRERMSASRVRFTLAGSTANWPDRDIHYLYKLGTQHRFHTRCPCCETYSVLDDYFPECIKFDAARDDYGYVCRACGGWLPDAQDGEWRALFPEKSILSIHFPQFLSPTISARELIESFYNADDLKNFYNRKLGKPFLDPTTVPVNLEMLNACAELGMSLGVVWKRRSAASFMGIDQMGQFNVVLIAERLPAGQMAIIHAEEIYDADPFIRCDELIAQYSVQCCVLEQLPNFNDAHRFANRHKGIVFLAGYAQMQDEMLRWGDAVPSRMDRKTEEEERTRYTVTLDQYKVMQVALKRIQTRTCVFPDPVGLVQEVRDKGVPRLAPILKDRVFFHLTRTALIAAPDDEERKYRRRVVKVGIDPHFSYAFMLLSVAWVRAFGSSTFILPQSPAVHKAVEAIERAMPGLPADVTRMVEAGMQPETCGACQFQSNGECTLRNFRVGRADPACGAYTEAEAAA